VQLAIDAGHLRADADAAQIEFEIHGLVLVLHHDARFMRLPGSAERARRGFERLIDQYKAVCGSDSSAQK
jgi:hypothetical protein